MKTLLIGQVNCFENDMDKDVIDSFWKKRTIIKDPRVAIHFRHDDMHVFDLQIIRKHLTATTQLLDLACGTCFFSNELIDEVAYIKAVDKFGEFLAHCKKVPNLETVVSDLLKFTDSQKYNVALLIGVMHFFNDDERKKVYQRVARMLAKNGVLYIRHQCGVNSTVDVDSFSEAVGDRYCARYLHIQEEKEMLGNIFHTVDVIDIFPKRLNPWRNTHYYAFVCRK